ncbi:hypothetical protein BOX15_Mlig013743g1, partial [Macrostomum lignano]
LFYELIRNYQSDAKGKKTTNKGARKQTADMQRLNGSLLIALVFTMALCIATLDAVALSPSGALRLELNRNSAASETYLMRQRPDSESPAAALLSRKRRGPENVLMRAYQCNLYRKQGKKPPPSLKC